MQKATSTEGDPGSLIVIPIQPSRAREHHRVDNSPWAGPLAANQDAPSHDLCNLIVNYLPIELREDDLMALFVEHGEIAHVKVVIDYKTYRSLGYGFVKYKRAEAAQRAVEMKNGFNIGTKRIKVSFSRLPVSFSRLPKEALKRTTLFLANLPLGFDEDSIKGILRKVRI